MRIHAGAPPARARGGATCGAPSQDATWNVRRAMRASVSVWVLVMGFAGVSGEGVCGEDRRLEAEAAGSQWVRTDTVAPGGRHFHAIAAAEHAASTVGIGLAARAFVHGGQSLYLEDGCFSDLWALESSPAADTVRWRQLWKGARACAAPPYDEGLEPGPLRHHSLAHLNGQLILFGGMRCDVNLTDSSAVSDALWAYRLQTDNWQRVQRAGQPVGTRPEARFLHTATVLPGVVGVVDAGMYVFGGLDDRPNLGHRPLRDLWRLQASASAPYVQWERLENAPVASWGHASVGYGRRLFVHGGSNITYASHQAIHEQPWQNQAADYEYLSGRLLQYDTVERSWTILSSCTYPRMLHVGFVARAAVGAGWRLSGADTDEPASPPRHLLYVYSGEQSLHAILANLQPRLKGPSNAPSQALLLEVYDLEANAWYNTTNISDVVHPPLLVGAAASAAWHPDNTTTTAVEEEGAAEEAQNARSVWVLGGKNDALQHVWSGNVAEETTGLLQFVATQQPPHTDALGPWAHRMAQVGPRRNFAAAWLPGDDAAATPGRLLVHGGWLGVAPAGARRDEARRHVYSDAMLWSPQSGDRAAQWTELDHGNRLMPTMGHSMVVAGDPRAVILFGGLSVDSRYSHPTAQPMRPGLLEVALEDVGVMASGETRLSASWRLSKFPYTEHLHGSFGQLEPYPAEQWSLLSPLQGARLRLMRSAPTGGLTSPALILATLQQPAVTCTFAVSYPESFSNGSSPSIDGTLSVRLDVLRGTELLYSIEQPLAPTAMNSDGTVPYTMQRSLHPPDAAAPAHPNPSQLLRDGAVRFRLVATASGLLTDEHSLMVLVSSIAVSDQAARTPTPRSLHTAVFVPPPAAVSPTPPSMFGAVTDLTTAVAGAAGHMVVYGGYTCESEVCHLPVLPHVEPAAEQMSGELWALDLAVGRWTALRNSTARFAHTCVVTATRVMLCYGGRRLDAADDTVSTGDDLWRYTFSSTGDMAGDADADAAAAATGWEQLQHDAHRPSPGALEDAAAVALPGLRDGMLLLGGRRESGGDPVGALWRLDVHCTGTDGSAASALWSRIHPVGTSSFSRVPPHASHLLFWASDETLLAFGGSKPANQPNQDAWLEPAVTLPDGLEVSTSAALWSWNATRCGLGRGPPTAEEDEGASSPTCPTQPILCGIRSQPATVNVVLLGATSADPFTLYVTDTEADVAVPVRTSVRNSTLVGQHDALVFLVEDIPVWRLPSQTFTVTAVSAQGSMQVQCEVSLHSSPACYLSQSAMPPPSGLSPSTPPGVCPTVRVEVTFEVVLRTPTASSPRPPLLFELMEVSALANDEEGNDDSAAAASAATHSVTLVTTAQRPNGDQVHEVQCDVDVLASTRAVQLVVRDAESMVVVARSDELLRDEAASEEVAMESMGVARCPSFPKVTEPILVTTGIIRANLQHTQCAGHGQVAIPAQAVCVYLTQRDVIPERPISLSSPRRQTTNHDGVVDFPVFTSVAHYLHFYHCEDRISGMTQQLQFVEFHEPQRVPSLDSLGSSQTVVGPVPGVHPLMCCGDTTLSVVSTTFPPLGSERLVVPPNTTCTWTIEPVANALHVELILVREHLAASDLLAIFLGSDTGMVSTSVGPKASNWTMIISATRVMVQFSSGAGVSHVWPANSILGSFEQGLSSNSYYTVLVVIIVFAAVISVMLVTFCGWRYMKTHRLTFFGRRSRQTPPDRRETTWIEDMRNQSRQGSVNRHRHLPSAYMSKIPVYEWSAPTPKSESKKKVVDESCSICLMEYDVGCKLRRLPCEHVFHSDCVKEWFEHERTCPYCKADVAHAIHGLYADELRAEGAHDLVSSASPDPYSRRSTDGRQRDGEQRGQPPAESPSEVANPFERASLQALAEELLQRSRRTEPSSRAPWRSPLPAMQREEDLELQVEGRSLSFTMERYLAAGPDESIELTVQVDNLAPGDGSMPGPVERV